MKKLLIAFSIFLLAFCTQAQTLQPVPGYGFQWNRGRFTTLLGLPNDTFAVTGSNIGYPWLALKANVFYYWNTSLLKWELVAGISSGIHEVVAGYGLLNVNDSTLKVDSNIVFSDLTWERTLLNSLNGSGYYIPQLQHNLELDMNSHTFGINEVTDFYVNLETNEWAISGGNGGSNTATIIAEDGSNRIRIISGITSTNKSEMQFKPDSIVMLPGGNGSLKIDSIRNGSSYEVNKLIGWRDNNGVVGYITPGYGIDLVAGILKLDTADVATPYALTQLNKYRFGVTGEDDDIQDDRYANFHDTKYLYLDSLFGFGASFNGNEGYSITNLTTNSLMLRLNDASGAQLLSPNGSNYIQVLDDQMNLILANAANDSLMINDINEVTKDDGDFVLVQRGSVGSKRISKVPVADFVSGATPTLQEVTTAGNTTFNPISITYSSAGTSAFSTINQNVGSAIYASNTGSGMVGNFELEHTSTNTVRTIVSYSRSTTGTTSAGLGQKHSYLLEADAGGSYEAASLNILWDDATEGSATSRVVFNTMGAGSVLNTLTLNGNGQIQFNEYTGSNFNTAQAKVAMVGTDGKIYAVDTTGLFGGGGGGGFTNLTQFVSQNNWKTFYSDGSGDVQELSLGAAGSPFYSTGTSAAPAFFTGVTYATSTTNITFTPLNTTDDLLLLQGISSYASSYFKIKNSGGTTLLDFQADGDVSIDGNTFFADATNNRVRVGGDDASPQMALQVGIIGGGSFSLSSATLGVSAGGPAYIVSKFGASGTETYFGSEASNGLFGTFTNHPLHLRSNNTTWAQLKTSGEFSLGISGTRIGVLQFNGNTSGTIDIKSKAAAGTYTLVLPDNDGNSGEFLQTDGAGNLIWAAAGSGGITIGTTTITSGTNTKILFNNSGVVGEYTISGTGNVAMTTSPTLTTPIIGKINDASNNELLQFTTVGSAVNHINIANNATGGNPTIGSIGDDANIGVDFSVTGTGKFNFKATTSGPTEIRLFEDVDNGVNYGGIIVPSTLTGDRTYTFPDASTSIPIFSQTITFSGPTAARTYTLPDANGTIGVIDATQTLTNKRITKRVTSTASGGATPTMNTDNADVFIFTAQAAAITSMTTNLSGTPTDGQTLWIAITDDGTPRTITWGASFEASTVPLPTTTVTSTRLDILFIRNAATSKWRCVAAQ